MNTIEILETGTTLLLPEDGQEFSRAQFLTLSRLMLQYNAGQLSYDQFKIKLVYDFLGLVRSVDIQKEENINLLENLSSICGLVDNYFYEAEHEGKKVRSLHMTFFEQLIPYVVTRDQKFYGPSTALFNTCYGEYLQALTAFNEYSLNGDVQALHRMIATLYRPSKKGLKKRSDHREKFDAATTDHYMKYMARLSPVVKHAIYLFFASCQHFIVNCTELDIGGGNTIDLSVLFNNAGGSKKTQGLGWVGTLYGIAQTNVFGSVEKVAEQNTYDIFAFLVERHREMKALKTTKK
ncbi:MAG: hypothetical protein AB3N16_15140 [Flavobacteriaceae bacterium]